jgi:hypothetical protein
VTQEWQGVSRVGEPELIHGQSGSSLRQPNEYRIRTTPPPAEPHRTDWLGYFNDKLKHPPITAFHNGNAITAYCEPDAESKLVLQL